MGLPVDAQHVSVLDHGHRVEVGGPGVLEERNGYDGAGSRCHLPHGVDGRAAPRRSWPTRRTPGARAGRSSVPRTAPTAGRCRPRRRWPRPPQRRWRHGSRRGRRRTPVGWRPPPPIGSSWATPSASSPGRGTLGGPAPHGDRDYRPGPGGRIWAPDSPSGQEIPLPSRSLESTPRADGFSMPAEWERHARCYLVWPERSDTWRLGAKPAQAAFLDVAEAVATGEPVTVLASARQWEHARASCSDAVSVVEMTTDDAWVRDTGPTFVVKRSTRRAARGRLGLQCLGRTGREGSTSRGPRMTGWRPRCVTWRTPPATAPHWSSKAAPSTSTARGRASPPRSAFSTPTATHAVPDAHRVPSGCVPGRGEGDLDPSGCARGRDQRTRRQSGLLLAPGPGPVDLERGSR